MLQNRQDTFSSLSNINQKGGNITKIIVIVVILGIVGFGVFYYMKTKSNDNNIKNLNQKDGNIHIQAVLVKKEFIIDDNNKLILDNISDKDDWKFIKDDTNKDKVQGSLQNITSKLYLNKDLSLKDTKSIWTFSKDKSNFHLITNSDNEYLSLDKNKKNIILSKDCNNDLCKWLIPGLH